MRKSQYFLFLMLCAKQGYHFYNVFGTTQDLDWGLNPGPPALDASTLPLSYRGGGYKEFNSIRYHILANISYRVCLTITLCSCISVLFLLYTAWFNISLLSCVTSYHILCAERKQINCINCYNYGKKYKYKYGL